MAAEAAAAAAAAAAAGISIWDLPLTVIDGPGNKQPEMYSSTSIPLGFAIIAVFLRFWSRRMKRAPLWYDDWLMLPALAGAITSAGVAYWALAHDDGKYIGTVTYGKLRLMGIVIFIAEILYSIVLGLVKFSILALYYRIFTGKRWVRVSVWTLAAIILAWAFANTMVICFQCVPIRGFWDRTVPATCNVDVKLFLTLTAFVNVGTDILMLVIPIVECLRLQQTRVNKVLLIGVFGTGFLVTIISCIRLISIFHMNITDTISALNITWSFVDVSMWTEVEQSVAIISSCLPCLKPVFSKVLPSSLVPSSRKKSTPGNSGASSSKKSGQSADQKGWIQIGGWRQRQRKSTGGTFTELMETTAHGSDSELPLDTKRSNPEHSLPADLESGQSGISVRTDSAVPEIEYQHELVTLKAHDPRRNATG